MPLNGMHVVVLAIMCFGKYFLIATTDYLRGVTVFFSLFKTRPFEILSCAL